ncbi:PspC domain-containing protein [Aliifodinibius sp. 1BSP15-2V2]|uniref:PspC domain-containing protein n=2 Tax=Fodinibius salsisoli TaxID=2820877 RepID=A0ABT3PNF8_9BACT|nr:PspC domain-containing protein [Fodinibius salsisoli]
MVQTIGLSIGPDLTNLVTILPFVGGVLVTLVGFGFFVGDRKKEKQAQKRQKRQEEQRQKSYRYDFEADDVDTEKGDFTLNNDLGNKERKQRHKGSKYQFDRYGYREEKKLYKSRSDKKISGVCSGLAKYFGISTTVVRLLFVVTFFAGSGTSLLLYIALAFALDKEPTEDQKKYRYDF